MDNEAYKKRMFDTFYNDVEWLQKHLPPDDVYRFSQQCLVGAVYLISRWKEGFDFDELDDDPISRSWVRNFQNVLYLEGTEWDGIINTDIN